MSDRLDRIAIFVAVAELESFAQAAQRLNKTPAAVTRAVASLEDQLHVRLLNRTTRSVALTEEGARYLEACRRLLAAYDDVQSIDTGNGGEAHGRLTITAPAMFGRLHVMPAIARFLQRHPRIEMRALLLDRVVFLVDEGIDAGIRLGNLPDSSMRAVRVGEVRSCVYGSPDYLARHGAPSNPMELSAHSTISCLTTTPIPERWSFEGALGVGAVGVKPRLIVNTTDGAAEAAAAGLGLTYLVSYQAEEHVRAGRLMPILTNFRPPPIPIHVIRPAGRFPPAKVRLFIDHVSLELRRTFDRE